MDPDEKAGEGGRATAQSGTYLSYGSGQGYGTGHGCHTMRDENVEEHAPAAQDVYLEKEEQLPTTNRDDYLDEKGEEKAEDSDTLERTSTGKRDNFQPLDSEDEEIVMKIARTVSRSYTQRSGTTGRSDLERTDTLAGLEINDEVFDPSSPKFDLYKYLRMTMKIIKSEDMKIQQAGVTMKDVNVRGSGAALNLQSTVGSILMAPLRLGEMFSFGKKPSKHILRDFQAQVNSGEMLVVLGRPGSGCSTFLKTMTGELSGLELDESSVVEYNGVPQERMLKEFRGEAQYCQEVDKHFPHLTVGETLEHAAALRAPSHRAMDMSRNDLVKHLVQVVMAIYGLSHTYNTKVGDDFVRGVSGGERKRVSIAEMALAGSAIAAWDNATRGLDSATAYTFTKSLRQTADLTGSTQVVAIYQASQPIYDLFDRAVVLYEGRQIYYGPATAAKGYFEEMGWYCMPRQTTGDFLTSVTNPSERQPREGFENKVPRTPDEFAAYWQKSDLYAALQKEMSQYRQQYAENSGQGQLDAFREVKHDRQVKNARDKSPYVVSPFMQVKMNMRRQWHRIKNDPPSTLAPVISNIVMSLIIGSVFYGTPNTSAAFQSKGAILFFAILLSALSAIAEINSLYAQRPIVEKHKSYAFYHPWTEAIAGIVLDVPIKFIQSTCFNIILYFLAGLRREPSQFFLFFLITFISTFVMSAVFRTMAALTKTVSQAMAFSGVLVLAIVVYTGFTIPVPSMHPWFGWIRWINPVFYAFEILVANEFHGRRFDCGTLVPPYANLGGDSFICSTQGAVAGEATVSGDAFIQAAYTYTYAHVWRNFGILLAFLFGFMVIYLVAIEINSNTSSVAEVLVFRRGHVPAYMDPKASDDDQGSSEKSSDGEDKDKVNIIPAQTDVFTWKDVTYDIEVKDGQRRLLDNVSGWVKPGTLTALMGTSGAGKTTLLDVLAQRTSMGVITGDMLVNGNALSPDFQRNTGYVQQQDLHLETATVRESLRFSAILRQPKSTPREEKIAYVEEVITMLGMEEFAEAVVGVPGEGLNVEQRKLLTIGVELAAKPKLLLFLDEPTSGLDSQSAWAICAFLRKLADNGQAVLCTIHQPSAVLFQQFDRLLFLRKGGQTVYFGPIGENSKTLLSYFEEKGGRKCSDEENPAEYMLEIAASQEQDWHETWKDSQEAKDIYTGIDEIHRESQKGGNGQEQGQEGTNMHSEFAMPFSTQLAEVTRRVFQQYWRMPSYIAAKMLLSTASGLFIGFSFFQADNSQQGMQIVLYSLFMVSAIFSTLVQQIMPLFVTQRSLYEVRERPSKAYSWKAFLCANIIVEWPYQIVAGLLTYASFYYPVVGVQSSERQGLVLVLCVAFFIYAATFAHLCIAALPDAQTAGSIVTLLFSMTLIFNGIMQSPSALPGFWIFMYRVSPLTYWVGGMAAAMLWGRQIECTASEANVFDPPAGQTCGAYLAPYLAQAPGQLQNPDATANCRYCALSSANQFLGGVNIEWSDRWRDFGLMWVYIGFNVMMAIFLYWFFRVRQSSGKPSFSIKGKAAGMLESLRARTKRHARMNKGNAQVI